MMHAHASELGAPAVVWTVVALVGAVAALFVAAVAVGLLAMVAR